MITPEIADQGQTKNHHFPRWVTLLLLALAFLLIHIAIPWRLSKLSTRHGWVDQHPSRWNLLALVMVIPGIAATIAMIFMHYRASPNTFLEFQQSRKLITPGPYAFSRNPMYVTELGFWLGWALYYGSLPVLIGTVLWFVLFNFLIVPYEERDLEKRFGEAYRQYQQAVPRWLGKTRT